MLATMKLGAVMIPATTLLKRGDIQDRLERGRVRAVIADRAQAVQFDGLAGAPIRISVGGSEPGWRAFEEPEASDRALVPGPDPLRLAVPKAFVVLVAGAAADAATARSILEHVRGTRLALPAHSAPRIYGLAEDHFREDPPRRAAPCRTGSAGRRSAPDLRVLGA
jgi:acyl-coenzyme A synthetase/AMP-(fatty) acid ligase